MNGLLSNAGVHLFLKMFINFVKVAIEKAIKKGTEVQINFHLSFMMNIVSFYLYKRKKQIFHHITINHNVKQ